MTKYEANRAWKLKNPEKNRESARQTGIKSRKADPSISRNASYRWREANREKSLLSKRLSEQKRRARRLQTEDGSVLPEAIDKLKVAQKNTCWWCTKTLTDYHIDHRIPLSMGGAHAISNLVLACPPCNLRRGASLPWQGEHPRLL